jgi:hypothetical protein
MEYYMEDFVQRLQTKYMDYLNDEDLEMMKEIRCMTEACLCDERS